MSVPGLTCIVSYFLLMSAEFDNYIMPSFGAAIVTRNYRVSSSSVYQSTDKEVLAGIHITKNGSPQAALFHESLKWSQSRIGSLVCATLVPFFALTLINTICYWRSFNGYFAADDFVHVSYLAKVFNGHPELILQNFTGNWMQAEGTRFYRPLISLTLAWDYLLGSANAFTFHLSNLIFQIGSTLFLFLLGRRLAQPISPSRAGLVAFFGAALFAAWPLHCEVVSWVIGRVDSVCAMFYLAAFWLFLKAKQDKSVPAMIASGIALVLSFLSKEMAVTMPAAATLYLAMQPTAQDERKSWKERAVQSLRATLPLWLILFCLLAVRTAALGTFTGGYSGSVGDSLTNSILHRFFGDGSLQRVFLPFNAEIFQPKDFLRRGFQTLYLLVAATAVARFAWFRYEAGLTRLIPFCALWFLIILVPTYQVFNIAPNLQCSRFAYLATAPLCLLIASIAVPLGTSRRAFASITTWLCSALLCVFVVFGMAATIKNNAPWIRAADQTRAFRNAIEVALTDMPETDKLVVLNVPERMQGAHMIYNGSMLNVLLTPPLSKKNLIDRVISFEPPMWGEPDMINRTRLRQLVETASVSGFKFYKWNMNTLTLEPINFATAPKVVGKTEAAAAKKEVVSIEYDLQNPEFATTGEKTASVTLLSPALAIKAPSVDFVDISFAVTKAGNAANNFVVLSWKGLAQDTFPADQKLALPVIADGAVHSYRFHVSEHKTWMMAGVIDHLAVDFPFSAGDSSCLKLKSIGILAGDAQIPLLSIKAPLSQGNDGTYYPMSNQGTNTVGAMPCIALSADSRTTAVRRAMHGIAPTSSAKLDYDATAPTSSAKLDYDAITPTSSIQLDYDATTIVGADAAILEISPPNTWFEHYSGTLRDTPLSPHAMKSIKMNGARGSFELPFDAFPSGGFYEVRAFAISKDGVVLGYASDPITIQMNTPLKSARKL